MQSDREEELGRIEAGQAEPRSQLRGPDENQRMLGGKFDGRRGFERATKESSDYGPSGDHYLDLKEQRLAEERHYKGQLHDSPRTRAFSDSIGRRRWDEEQPSHRVRFEDDSHFARGRGPTSQRWEDDERELMQWAKSKGQSRHRLPTPPYESPRKQEARPGKGSQRSISAPVIAEGIAGLGVRDDPVALRNRQQEYAEELRAQIREREEARKREKMELRGTSPRHEVTQTTRTQERPPGHTDNPPKHSSSRNGRYSPRDDRDRSDTMDHSRKPLGSSYDRHEQYAPYPAPHYADYPGYYPQMNYPRPWIPPYYQPRPAYPPPPDILPDPYYPPSHPPHMGNPYLYHGRLGPEFWEADFRGRRRPEEAERRHRDQSPTHKDTQEDISDTSPLTGGGSGLKARQQSKASYRAQLERQIQEKKEKEMKGRIERESFELKKEAEIYDPWGKGGCGAPVRDNRGKLVADLKKMRQINNDKLLRGPSRSAPAPPSRTPGIGDDEIDLDVSGSPSRPQYSYSSHEAREKEEGEELHKKSQQEEYRDFLRKQVEEKEAYKMREKEEQMVEEQRELERLEKERKRMQDDYEREMEIQRRKEGELRLKNEALKHEAEEKRRAAALKRQQEELREAELEAEKQKLALVRKMEQPLSNLPVQRSKSPPIPALLHKRGEPPTLNPPTTETIAQTTIFRSSSPPVPALQQKHTRPISEHHPVGIPKDKETPPFRTNSPPVPTLRNKMLAGTTATTVSSNPPLEHKPPAPRPTQPTAEPAGKISEQERQESLRQLSAMRYHLQSQLARQQHRSGKSSSSEDSANIIFDMAKSQKPRMVVPRARKPPKEKDGSLSAALKEFDELKTTTSSKEILAKFPSAPETSSMLEYQQDALLRHQEDRIARLRLSGRRDSQNHIASSRGSSLLASESTHLPIEDPFSERLGLEPSQLSVRNPNPNPPRQNRQWPLRNGSAGTRSQFSVATVEVDRMARRNEERGRRLDAILNADAREGRQTVIHNFLKQTDRTYARRLSEESLDCETGFHPINSAHS